jgi:hypothetical protein
MRNINDYQLTKITKLLQQLMPENDHAAYLLIYTNDRTGNLTELTHKEAEEIMTSLKKSVKS